MEGLRKNIKIETTNKDRQSFKYHLETEKESERMKFEQREGKKSRLEEKMINLAGIYIKKYTEKLNINNIDIPNEKDIYFIKSDPRYTGTYYNEKDLIEIRSLTAIKPIKYLMNITNINKDTFEKFGKMKTVIHEALHFSGYNMRGLPKINEETDYEKSRVGFHIYSPKNGNYFSFLNEAMTEFITDDILNENFEEIKKELKMKNIFGLNENLYKKLNILMFKTYYKERNLISRIIKESKININELKKGYFTGNMLCLRKIEETYGPGSLRILALQELNPAAIIGEAIYFDLNTPENLRNKIKEGIINNLPEEEKVKIDNHIQKMTRGK